MIDSKKNTLNAAAIKYDGRGAPKLTAKGEGASAEKIIALAKEHGIPIQENAILLDILKSIPLNEEIPETLYLAVAEILAFAYKLSGKPPPPSTRSAQPANDATHLPATKTIGHQS